jgi:hypothetical protein
MGQHLNNFKKLVTKGIKPDSFVSHFTHHCKKEVKPTSNDLRKMMKVKIVWQGNVMSCMKSVGKLNCSLCLRERIEILRTIRQEEWKIMNHCNEIYGACRHKTRFHRFLKEHTNMKNTSTDEGDKPACLDAFAHLPKMSYVSHVQLEIDKGARCNMQHHQELISSLKNSVF